MTPSRIPSEPVSFTTPIIDCEPPPVGVTACPPPSPRRRCAAFWRSWTGGGVRVRMVDGDAAEVFATHTRAHRLRAIAGRIQHINDRWRIVALQIG